MPEVAAFWVLFGVCCAVVGGGFIRMYRGKNKDLAERNATLVKEKQALEKRVLEAEAKKK